jgi:hypothetical protein
MAKPTHDQIKAVHKALYKDNRIQELTHLMHNLAASMNLNPSTQLPGNDVRNPAGSGPQWFFPDTGAVDNLVIRSAGYCDQIAHTILAMRSDIQQVDFPQADKQNLSKALSEEAASWTLRGQLWRASGKPADPDQAAAQISAHLANAEQAAKRVRPYLRTAQEVGVR